MLAAHLAAAAIVLQPLHPLGSTRSRSRLRTVGWSADQPIFPAQHQLVGLKTKLHGHLPIVREGCRRGVTLWVFAASVVLSLMHALIPQVIALTHKASWLHCRIAASPRAATPALPAPLAPPASTTGRTTSSSSCIEQHAAAGLSFGTFPRPTYFGWSGRSWLVCQTNQPVAA